LTGQDIAMLAVAVVGGAAALLVVTARNVVHAALYLVVALLAVAGTFLVVGAEFLAWTQVLVYVGAVVVLILFGLMLTRAPIGPMAQHNDIGRMLPLAVAVGLFALLAVLIFQAFGDVTLTVEFTPTAALGEVLYTHWAFPFMALGFFLTVALIGAVVIARREEGEGPDPHIDTVPGERPTPVPTDASSSPGVSRWEEEVAAGAAAGGEEE
jgi:NADH-quinone oxidoreductase subunit J